MKQKQFSAIVSVDLGVKKYHVCVTDKNGTILVEQAIPNSPQ